MPPLDIQAVRKIYCIAICGMGMGSLAGLLKGSGYEVSGSDAHTYPPMSDQLREQGIEVIEGYKAENVPADADLVIIGNAISKGHPEVEAVEALGLPYLSMADALAEFFLKKNQSIVVAGTHGKTTTSSYLAWLLSAAGRDPGFLIGGILKNFDRSWQRGDSDLFVVEGDEYDTAFFDKTPKFLHYCPRYAILNAIEFDHADIYKDLADVKKAFRSFVEMIPPSGHLFAFADSENVREVIQLANCPITLFGEDAAADYRLLGIEATERGSQVVFNDSNGKRHELMNPLPGRHNACNLLGVFACLQNLGLTADEIQKGLDQFQGIKRRQEVRGVVRDITVIDDFAHHPTAVRETLQALRGQYPGRKLWSIFEPRSNTSRQNIFQDEFGQAFGEADDVIFAPPYDNGKIPPEQLLDVTALAQTVGDLGSRARHMASVDEIVATVAQEAKPGDVIAILSNGGFGGIHEKLLSRLAGK